MSATLHVCACMHAHAHTPLMLSAASNKSLLSQLNDDSTGCLAATHLSLRNHKLPAGISKLASKTCLQTWKEGFATTVLHTWGVINFYQVLHPPATPLSPWSGFLLFLHLSLANSIHSAETHTTHPPPTKKPPTFILSPLLSLDLGVLVRKESFFFHLAHFGYAPVCLLLAAGRFGAQTHIISLRQGIRGYFRMLFLNQGKKLCTTLVVHGCALARRTKYE